MTEAQTASETANYVLESGAVMLGAAIIFVMLCRKLRLGATLGYIVGGVVIGPHLLGLFLDPVSLSALTELGIALLLFIVGLEIHPSRPSGEKLGEVSASRALGWGRARRDRPRRQGISAARLRTAGAAERDRRPACRRRSLVQRRTVSFRP